MMEIRFYRPEDYNAVLRLWHEAGLMSVRVKPERDIPRMANGHSSTLLIGMKDDQCIATIMAGNNGYRGWVQKLAVAEKYRRQGYGCAMVKAAERWMIARGFDLGHLIVLGNNEEAKPFYESLGYEKSDAVLYDRKLDKVSCNYAALAEMDVIVTYLEMTTPPHRPRIPMPVGNYALLRLERPSVGYYRFLYNSVGDPWFWIDRRKVSDTELHSAIQDEKVEIYVLYAGGEPAGFIEINRREEPLININYFGLLPGWIGKGLGKYLLHWAVDYIWSLGPNRVTVDTCTLDHPSALARYQQIGFQPYKQIHKRITDPRLEGYIPQNYEPLLPAALMPQDLT